MIEMNSSSVHYVPLNLAYITDTRNLYITLLTWRYTLTFATYDFTGLNARMIRNTKCSIRNAQKASGLSRQTFDAVAHRVPEKEEFNSFIILLPFELIDKWAEWLQDKSPRSRESWTRLYMYVYGMCMHNPTGFYNSVENIAALLGMCHSDVSRKLIELEEAKWLVRANYCSSAHICRAYLIPKEWKYFSY